MDILKSFIRKNRSDFLGVFFGKYPKFILSNQNNHLKDVPIFVFHDVTPETLEPLLIYLAKNSYKTLCADELVSRYKSGDTFSQKELVLTFDDGERSLYEVAYPLLKKYGFSGVAFIVPGLVPDDEKRDGWISNNKYLCSWSMITKMHDSGVLDFQSHSMYHHTIFVSPKIVDFVTPSYSFKFPRDDVLPIAIEKQIIKFPDSLQLGTPLYESDFRLNGRPQYIDSLRLRQACTSFVSQRGGIAFFQYKKWRREFKNYVRNIFSDFAADARYETNDLKDNAIRNDFRYSKKILEHKLTGKKIKHFCFPWFSGCKDAVRLSGEEGYVSNFWGGILPKFASFHTSPLPFSRLNPLYIWRLPGRGRKSLGEVLRLKYSAEIARKAKRVRTPDRNHCSGEAIKTDY
jgi:hypothetical protein